MEKADVIKIIDDVMNNREIDSIRNAILAIRDKVLEIKEPEDNWNKEYYAKLKLRGNNALCNSIPFFEGAKYVCIDTTSKIDTGYYGEYWYE